MSDYSKTKRYTRAQKIKWQKEAFERGKERRAEGLCKCGRGQPVEGKKRCAECVKRDFEWRKKRTELAREKGFCTRCCIRPKVDDQQHCLECRERDNATKRKIYQNNKALVYKQYGNKCRCCGEDEQKFLQLDHVNNDGASHRREIGLRSGSLFHKWVIENNFPDNLQLLCANCNQGKLLNNGVCPHQESKIRDVNEFISEAAY